MQSRNERDFVFKENGPVVQLVRMPPCHGGGRGFESRPFRKKAPKLILRGFLHFMEHFVYIILSLKDSSYYKGYTLNPMQRLLQHNRGESTYTKTKLPWQLVYVEEQIDKRAALIREKALKKYSHLQIEKLIVSDKNIIGNFIKV